MAELISSGRFIAEAIIMQACSALLFLLSMSQCSVRLDRLRV